MIEWLVRIVLMFPAWPVMLVWFGVVLAFVAINWCIVYGRPVRLYLDGTIPVVVTAAWVVVIYAWITFNPDLPVTARVSPVRLAFFFEGLALMHFSRRPIEELFYHVGKGVHRRLHREH